MRWAPAGGTAGPLDAAALDVRQRRRNRELDGHPPILAYLLSSGPASKGGSQRGDRSCCGVSGKSGRERVEETQQMWGWRLQTLVVVLRGDRVRQSQRTRPTLPQPAHAN